MKSLLKSLASSLVLEVDPPAPSPVVYTTAIQSAAELVPSLAGIAQIARALGFSRTSETVYAHDGCSATFHAEHERCAVALAVDCCPTRQTVSLAVSGLASEETYALFSQVSDEMFGVI